MFLAWSVVVCLLHILWVQEIGGDTGPCREHFFNIIFKLHRSFCTYMCIFILYTKYVEAGITCVLKIPALAFQGRNADNFASASLQMNPCFTLLCSVGIGTGNSLPASKTASHIQ